MVTCPDGADRFPLDAPLREDFERPGADGLDVGRPAERVEVDAALLLHQYVHRSPAEGLPEVDVDVLVRNWKRNGEEVEAMRT